MSSTATLERRLAAVAFADVAGYSRLIEADDIGTTLRWRSLRQDLIAPKIEEHHGRLVRAVGDGLFIEFRSAVDAVRWAHDVQRGIRELFQASDNGLMVRIGINVEDVIVDDDDLHGDGINVAARIHQLANPGETVMTSAVRDYVWNKLGISMTDLGEHTLKNITGPVRVFRLDESEATSRPRRSHPHLVWSNKPTIAVMPFQDLSPNADESYFGDGITEEIITALARSRSLYVIARTSTLGFRDRRLDPQRIAADLGVRYLLQGNVRRQEARLRISVELVDAAQNRAIWAQRYDGSAEDLFEFQDRIAASIVNAIEPRVFEAETLRVRAKPTDSLDAYDCMLRAYPLLYTFDKPQFAEAGAYLDLALQLDPNFAQAHAYKAWWYVLRAGEGYANKSVEESALAEAAAQRAVMLDDRDALVISVAAHVQGFLCRQPEIAAEMFEHALAMNENSSFAWGLSAVCHCYLGDSEEALERLRNVSRLSPYDPMNFLYLAAAGLAEFVAGRYEEAIAWSQKSRRQNPRFIACLRTLAACQALDGRQEQAAQSAAELLRIEPAFRISKLGEWYPLRRAGDLERYLQGLRTAGLPE